MTVTLMEQFEEGLGDAYHLAWFTSAKHFLSGLCFTQVPLNAKTTFTNNVFNRMVRHRLHIPQFGPIGTCPGCGVDADVYGLHFISGCNKTGCRIGLHDVVKNEVYNVLKDLGTGVVDLEPTDILKEVDPTDGKRPDVCMRVVSTAATGKPYKALEVALTNPFAGPKSGIWKVSRQQALVPQRQARKAVSRKHSIYPQFRTNAELAAKFDFHPIVLETTGRLEDGAVEFFQERARESAAVQGRPAGTIFMTMMKQLSTAFQKGIVEVLHERLALTLNPKWKIKDQQAPVAMTDGLILDAPPTVFTMEDAGEGSRIVWKRNI
jgi:hypothetical protein